MKDIFHSQRLLANLILKSHKFLVLFVIKRSVLEILHGNLSTHPWVCFLDQLCGRQRDRVYHLGGRCAFSASQTISCCAIIDARAQRRYETVRLIG